MAHQECRRKHTATEAIEWKVILEEKAQERKVDHYYMAQLAMMLKWMINVWTETREDLNIKDWLLNFKKESPEERMAKLNKRRRKQEKLRELKRKAEYSFHIWCAAFQLDPEEVKRQHAEKVKNAGTSTDRT
jgi:hypothetical protein